MSSPDHDDAEVPRPTTESASVSSRMESPSVTNTSLTRSTQQPTSTLTTRSGTASGRRSRTTATPSAFGHSESRTIICAISEARGVSPSVGIAFVDISLGEVTLSQICDNQSYVKTIHKIQMMSPSQIVFMSTVCPPNPPSTLYSLVTDLIDDVPVNSFHRSAWSEIAGLDYLQQLAFESDVEPIKVAIQGKFYATTSFAAVRKLKRFEAFSTSRLTYFIGYEVHRKPI